jgi:hypothetical protein
LQISASSSLGARRQNALPTPDVDSDAEKTH